MDDLGEQVLLDTLTDREQEILRLLSDGLSNQEIAQQLTLALETVKWYNKQIYSKLGVGRRTQAIARAQALGLLDDEGSPAHNLPVQMTAFINRRRELAELARLLAQEDGRLVSIVGGGGMGKTRLALEVAGMMVGTQHAVSLFPDGVYFVALASVSAPEHVVSTIAEATGIQFYGQEDPQRQLAAYLRRRHMLLVLDNFEHLLDGADIVTGLLQAAPGVKILITSREPLNISGETLLHLSGMDFPDEDAPGDALDYSAIQLFAQTARRLFPDVDLEGNNLRYVARVCQLVEGMPLGIVLAASWVQMLSPQEIADELSLDMLATDMRDVPERHRSMRAIFDATWQHMTQAEQDAFMKLSVFRGSFTRQAAQAVTGASLRTLAALVSKSLLQSTTDLYQIHELLRQYAGEQLADGDLTRQRHAAYYMAFIGERWPQMKDHRQMDAVQMMDAEIENIYAAWRYLAQQRDAAGIGEGALTLWFFHQLRSRFQEGMALFSDAVDALRSTTHPRELGLALVGQSWFQMAMGDPDTARTIAEEALALLEQSGTPEDRRFVYHSLAHICSFQDQVDDSTQAALRGLERAGDDPFWAGEYYYMLGWNAIATDDYGDARQHGEASHRLFERLGNPFGIVRASGVLLGGVAMWTVNYGEAKSRFHSSIQLYKAIGQTWGIAYSYRHLGRIAMWEGEYQESADCLRQSCRYFDATGQTWEIVVNIACLAEVRIAQDREAEAIELLTMVRPHSMRDVIRERVDDLLALLRGELPPDVFEAAAARGRALNLDTVVAEIVASGN